jgi:ribonuclease HII
MDLFSYDRQFLSDSINYIAGVDEAGRGPLAGPVCVASVIMPLDIDKIIPDVNDSKKLSEKKRAMLFDKIIELALSYKIEMIDEDTIDEINILNATKLGMKNSIENLDIKPDLVLIDAVKLDIDYNTNPIIHGDALSYNIACASILAKVTRDRYIKEISNMYPEYNFAKNKGYGTKEHIEALKKYGACKIHRETYLKNFNISKYAK